MEEVEKEFAEESDSEEEEEEESEDGESEDEEDIAERHTMEQEYLSEEFIGLREDLLVGEAYFDEEGRQLDDEGGFDRIQAEEYFAPDMHSLLFVNDEEDRIAAREREGMDGERETGEMHTSVKDVTDSSGIVPVRAGRGRSSMRRGRAVLGGRGRRRRCQAGNQQSKWTAGQPLEEIWVRDDDVPSKIKDLVSAILKAQEVRAQVIRDQVIRGARKRRRVSEDTTSESEDEDEFEDATNGKDSSLLHDESLHSDWYTMETFNPTEERFKRKRTGSVKRHKTPYAAFRSFWDDTIIEHIVKQTNRNAKTITTDSFRNSWTPTNAHEIMCLFAFWIMLGIVKFPTVQSCFSTSRLLKFDVFRRMFTYKRYTRLSQALYFSEDRTTKPTNSGSDASFDSFYPLEYIVTHLNAKFQANYIPSKDICIDESLILRKGKSDVKAAAKLKIKTVGLCESATGYLWSFIFYSGKHCSLDIHRDSIETSIVKKLLDPLLNKGYRLFLNNWYNVQILARFLKRNRTDCVGTLRSLSKDIPILIKVAPLIQGQVIARHCGDICVLSWQDRKRITMISTCHGPASGLSHVLSKPGKLIPYKPQVVLDYNKSMSGVDLKDQMLGPYLLEGKKSGKWYKTIFIRLVNISIWNARILLESSLQCHQDHLAFRLNLVDDILTHHLPHVPKPRIHTKRQASWSPGVVRNIHWPVLIEATNQHSQNRRPRLSCALCLSNKLRRKTTMKCEACDVPLCLLECFKNYHYI